MIKFGAAGNSESFYNEGHKASIEMPEWIKNRGLDSFEYSFGKGITISSATASVIGDEAKKQGVEMSVHAPYFINFSSPEREKIEKSFMYVTSSAKILSAFGGNRLVFHPGSPMKQDRVVAFDKLKTSIIELMQVIDETPYTNFLYCPETMGKLNQMGSVEEIAEICKIDDRLIPCVDFGHINARGGGFLKTADDYDRLIAYFCDKIGTERTNMMHVHFSHIQYSKMGEVKHLTFEDSEYGPFFEPLCEVIVKRDMSPYIICESAGTQAEDAMYMKSVYNKMRS